MTASRVLHRCLKANCFPYMGSFGQLGSCMSCDGMASAMLLKDEHASVCPFWSSIGMMEPKGSSGMQQITCM